MTTMTQDMTQERKRALKLFFMAIFLLVGPLITLILKYITAPFYGGITAYLLLHEKEFATGFIVFNFLTLSVVFYLVMVIVSNINNFKYVRYVRRGYWDILRFCTGIFVWNLIFEILIIVSFACNWIDIFNSNFVLYSLFINHICQFFVIVKVLISLIQK